MSYEQEKSPAIFTVEWQSQSWHKNAVLKFWLLVKNEKLLLLISLGLKANDGCVTIAPTPTIVLWRQTFWHIDTRKLALCLLIGRILSFLNHASRMLALRGDSIQYQLSVPNVMSLIFFSTWQPAKQSSDDANAVRPAGLHSLRWQIGLAEIVSGQFRILGWVSLQNWTVSVREQRTIGWMDGGGVCPLVRLFAGVRPAYAMRSTNERAYVLVAAAS